MSAHWCERCDHPRYLHFETDNDCAVSGCECAQFAEEKP